VEATLNFPGAVAVDRQGNLYIADTMNHRVRKMDAATGVISTIAGTGQHRCSGDGGPATGAALNEPSALAVDGRGYLYIADQSNNRVRRIDLHTGLITTVAGTGETGYTGDGMPAVEAGLSGPSGLAIGPDGDLYIADTFSGRIRRIDQATGAISTVAGDGGEYRFSGMANEFSTSLSRPYGIALDAAGNLLITDSDSHLIRRWDRKKKIITRLAGSGQPGFGGDGGDPLAGSLNYPFGVVVDHRGNVYIADTFNHRIRMIAA
jgi:DNA-binding beta-propeller fold protein YncE